MRHSPKPWHRIRPRLTAAIAAGALSAKMAHASAIFDDLTAIENGTSGANATYIASSVGEYVGNGITLASGATDITGFDCYVLNETGMNLSGVQINVFVWGSVNLGTISSSSPAFSNELAAYTFTDANDALPTGSYAVYESATTGTPGIKLEAPLAVPSNTIGITFNYQGSTNGITYSSMPGLTSYIGYGVPPTDGSNARGNSFEVAAEGETNGNFIGGPYAFNPASSYPDEAYLGRIYGDIASTVPDNWSSPSSGPWETATNWSTSNVPDGGATAVFNLSSSGYVVQIADSDDIANIVSVQQDNVSFNLNGFASELSINHALTVGQSPTTGTAIHGSLTLENTLDINPAFVIAGSVVVGGNGGTGSLAVTSGVYLYSNGGTTINAGSTLSIGQGAKLGTATLSIAGATNVWTGQLDIGPSDLVIRNGSIGTVTNQILTGYNNGQWNGQGIISSIAAADTTHLTAVGAIVNNDGSGNLLYGTGTALGLFDGEAPPLNAVLVRYTYFGDANLDGKVDGSDYSRIDNGALNQLTGWYNGDFNYDGVINGSDYTLIDNAYNTQTGAIPFNFASTSDSGDAEPSLMAAVDPIATRYTMVTPQIASASNLEASVAAQTTAEIAAPASVPEPTSLGMIALAMASLLGRRSRRMRCDS